MGKRWIFQDIKDIQNEVLHNGSAAEMLGRIPEYYKALREKVTPETYVRYELWCCDIYVDVGYIISLTCEIYRDAVDPKKVHGWLDKHKEPHHVFC